MAKPLEFLGDSLDRLKKFPVPAIKEIGHELNEIQEGREPSDWKSMKIVGPGVKEIRVSFEGNAYRTIYTIKLNETVYVLHIFQKKTRKTSRIDVNLAKKRLKELKEELKNDKTNRCMKSVIVGPDDNIFEVLGFDTEEAANLLIRSQLMGEIKQFIRDNKMSLREAAEYFGTSHPRINNLMQGRINQFKIDYLIVLLYKTGKSVKLQIEDLTEA